MSSPSLLCPAVLAALFLFAPAEAAQLRMAPQPEPNLLLKWYDGVPNFNIGNNLNCITQAFETTVSGYAGFTYLPPSRTHAVGEVFYTHLVLGHPGNPCTGSAVGIEISLPPGVQFANSTDNPAFCFARNAQPALINLGTDPDYGCPQTYPVSANGYRLIAPRGGIGGSGAWGMAQGFWIEMLIPLVATTPQLGNNQIVWTVNPSLGQFGQVGVGPQINSDVLFRTSNEDQMLTLTLCTLTPVAAGC
ncbi:MAG: hypothetical protein BGP24_00945 [Lysobacterales bacterium 69-70]|nr:hypothetical protein [Xanthomonadaceae bacterium]ODU36131.1 MAG: hypothetical protein ABS97_02025 [Xanthomonadaceae bacterium SCN 69-320]ODV18125.1 MAG: hypothetical protein ABT27_14410 [Xanthomonadaceae bacterium SCN 69-25]OJY99410.1 MAG: hypothetical protein BGP24_00945 [Xanthomonadales bacterium 69-70]